MPHDKIAALLKDAVSSLSRNDLYSFADQVGLAERYAAELPEKDPMRGEILLLQSLTSYRDPSKLLLMMEQADALLNGRSTILRPEDGGIENFFNVYTIWGSESGRADAFTYGSGDYAKAEELLRRMAGIGWGMKWLQKAQLAYYRGELDDALRYAKECRKENESAYRRESVVDVYALEILAGVAKHKMDFELWRKSNDMLRAIAAGKMDASRAGCEHAEVVSTMLDLSLGTLHDVPVWGKTGELGAIPAPWGYELMDDSMLASTMPAAMIAHIEYLSYSGEPVRALHAAGTLQKVFGFKNVIMSAYLEMLRAGCYLQMDKPRRFQEAVENAMSYIVPDRLWLIAAEFTPLFGEHILRIVKAHSPEGEERVLALSQNFMEKLVPLRNELIRGAGEELTSREREIVELVIEGYSNAEIAEKLNITVRTVRAHLEHAFAKFNVSRRSQLVSAMNQGAAVRLAHWVKQK